MYMQNRKGFKLLLSFVMPLLIVCVFAATALGVSALGASVFRAVQEETQAISECGVAAGYIRTKLMNAESAQNVSVLAIDGIKVLYISCFVGETEYETRIFLNEGVLKESFVQKGTPFSAQAANKIAKIKSCEFMLEENGMCTVSIVSTQDYVMRVAVQLAQEG